MNILGGDTSTNILREQFIPDNLFIYLVKGSIRVFDGNKSYTFQAGDACIARKNNLAKYEVLDSKTGFEPILFCFDEPFLKHFQEKYASRQTSFTSTDAFINVRESALITSFIESIKPYYKGVMQLEEAFEDLKYEELLIILLKNQPELAGVFFEFRKPGKIDLEEFMNRNYKFNVKVDQFAYLTGRSISAFKRDFKETFNDTPSHWLIKKRLEEAYFLINQQNKKSSEIYLDLGFEDLSHFSYAFKKQFGLTSTALAGLQAKVIHKHR
ncbi:AraC-type DNA-binding protein [Chitinophaga costaii]|uniref:AraC-type DNA-binding protein n=1 Tax=Chitinophaga costaii TaxID=1335309 RepID=A0A1C4EY00_9BACT|nr:AraC family transcriptional regulator [Chitinophaga costaii]PUZ21565.1 AraC family transcriptional regulator [Chitinophaga costaii]SCC48386.1 AraC-type DNA-binding protein [Chitinophaga costaii]